MALAMLQTGFWRGLAHWPAGIVDWVEQSLLAERDALFHWLPVMLGLGVAGWFLLPSRAWAGLLFVTAALALVAITMSGPGRVLRRVVLVSAMAFALGLGAAAARNAAVAAPVLERPVVTAFTATVEAREDRPAKDEVRLLLAPAPDAGLPPRIRVTLRDADDVVTSLQAGDKIRLRARLVPPPVAALPGGYDFARRAWFEGIGAVGSAIGPVEPIAVRPPNVSLRQRLSAHVRSRVEGPAGGIAAALATGDRGGISEAEEEAMRRSGLAHLLSISGLHITAAVGGVMWLALRLLALSPALALRWPLPLVAAAIGALAGLGYTLLTGSEVPTVRALLAALLVLLALALGREAITLRLVAAGACAILLIRPEALMGPSFQLSFAAITAIVALHGHSRVAGLLARREEGFAMRWLRGFAGLLLTGLAVELALMPIALFHFHKAGLYGSLANLVAIPLTTFIVMPAEALALGLDSVGLGAPAWWVVQVSLDAMLALAHWVAAAPGSVAALPAMPVAAFALALGGGLWLCPWQRSHRWLGAFPLLAGLGWAWSTPAPDLLVTGDGRHVAVRLEDGSYALLRDRAGDFIRDQLAEAAGIDGAMTSLVERGKARCSPDFCVWTMQGSGRRWTVMASRSSVRTDWGPLVEACARVDIVIADRWLPRGCVPRWLKADRKLLAETSGLAIRLGASPSVAAALATDSGKPWRDPPKVMPPRPGGSSDRSGPGQ
jgi:competence protein ComEC